MKQKKWILRLLLAGALLCLTGCEEEAPEEQEETAPVDKKVEALVIDTTSHTEDGQAEEKPKDNRKTEKEKEYNRQLKEETEVFDNQEQTDAGKEAASDTTAEPSPGVLDELNTKITEFVSAEQSKGTSVSVYAENLSSGGFASVESRQQQSASLIKLFIAGCVYEHPDILKTQESYGGETEELIRRMITVSDNDATNTLVTRLGSGNAADGMALVNEYCKSHNFPDTHMGRLMLDFNASDDNYTSVTDCGHFLSAVYRTELTGSESILSYLKQQERTGKIPAGVPAGVETANKTGELDDVENDAAIIFSSSGPYILCVILNQLPDAAAGRTMITGLSDMVYHYMEETG